MTDNIRLTQYSHGAGCGCKIAPQVLSEILAALPKTAPSPNLLVGHGSRDDAAVFDLGDGTAVISTTDFFMPIVDDPYMFGQIAATNALSDVYAMGGKPLMAIAILGWPIDKLGPDVAAQVLAGGQAACQGAGIVIAGGHSIDAPEPIFGLAVTGRVPIARLKRNDTAKPNDRLFLTKPLGVGILSTAEKKGWLAGDDNVARRWMCQLNHVGEQLAALPGVHAMTDVTGFGLAGHLLEMCQGAGVSATLDSNKIPVLDEAWHWLDKGAVPGGTARNFASYGQHLRVSDNRWRDILCDPQTSGGLLIAVDASAAEEVRQLLAEQALPAEPIGHLVPAGDAIFVSLV